MLHTGTKEGRTPTTTTTTVVTAYISEQVLRVRERGFNRPRQATATPLLQECCLILPRFHDSCAVNKEAKLTSRAPFPTFFLTHLLRKCCLVLPRFYDSCAVNKDAKLYLPAPPLPTSSFFFSRRTSDEKKSGHAPVLRCSPAFSLSV